MSLIFMNNLFFGPKLIAIIKKYRYNMIKFRKSRRQKAKKQLAVPSGTLI